MTSDSHYHFFEGGVPCAFSQSVDRHFHLACSVLYCSDRIGGRHAQVVMAVGGDDRFVHIGYMIHQVGDFFAVFIRQAIACSVGNVYNRSSGFDDGFYHACQIFVFRTSGIFGIKFYVVHELTGIFYGFDGTGDDVFRIGI